jgi:cytochrome c oxidase subunit 4
MSTDTTTTHDPTPGEGTSHGEHGEDYGHDGGAAEHGFSDRQYVQVALILAAITALEIYASYADWLGRAFIPLLLIMMVIKFVSVVLFFMHLKFDSKIFSWLFYSGLLLAVGVYVAALLTFKFFNP